MKAHCMFIESSSKTYTSIGHSPVVRAEEERSVKLAEPR